MTLFVAINCLAFGLIFSPSVVAVQSSTDQLMRNIVLNQSTDYYDEHAIEHLKTDPSTLAELSGEKSGESNTSAVANLEKLIAFIEKDIADKKKRNAEMVEAASQQTMLGSFSVQPANINVGDHLADNLTISKPYKALSAINEFPPDFMSDRVSLLQYFFSIY